MRPLCHFYVSYPESPHFMFMCAIDTATVKRSIAQFRSRQPRTETATPLASTAPSTSAPSSSVGGVTLKDIMAQLVCMNAHLDTLSDELCQVTLVLVVLHDDRLSWVVSLSLPLYLRQPLRMRMAMAPAVMMLMKTMMMARLVIMRCLLDLLALCHSWQKGRVVLRWE